MYTQSTDRISVERSQQLSTASFKQIFFKFSDQLPVFYTCFELFGRGIRNLATLSQTSTRA